MLLDMYLQGSISDKTYNICHQLLIESEVLIVSLAFILQSRLKLCSGSHLVGAGWGLCV